MLSMLPSDLIDINYLRQSVLTNFNVTVYKAAQNRLKLICFTGSTSQSDKNWQNLNAIYEFLFGIKLNKFDDKESISSVNNAKNSLVKQLRSKVLEQYPFSDVYIDQIIPKKESIKLVKCHDHIELFTDSQGDTLFFKQREVSLYPSLKLLHKYPFMLPHMQVDQGAIKFVLNGSNIMCPGLTSPGARMSKLDKGSVVAVMAEGKQHALAIGLLTMSSEDILNKNKGIGVENVHFLNDGLWKLKPIK